MCVLGLFSSFNIEAFSTTWFCVNCSARWCTTCLRLPGLNILIFLSLLDGNGGGGESRLGVNYVLTVPDKTLEASMSLFTIDETPTT